VALRHFLALWLTLLGACWAARAAVLAIGFQEADVGGAAVVRLAIIPLVQAVAVAWLTRGRSKPNGPGEPEEIREPDEDVTPAG
jgi:hypothetical protein